MRSLRQLAGWLRGVGYGGWRRSRHESGNPEIPCRQKTPPRCFNISYVCPEPVLVNWSSLASQKRGRFPRTDLDEVVRREEDVQGLDVAVHDLLVVDVLQPEQQLQEVAPHGVL